MIQNIIGKIARRRVTSLRNQFGILRCKTFHYNLSSQPVIVEFWPDANKAIANNTHNCPIEAPNIGWFCKA